MDYLSEGVSLLILELGVILGFGLIGGVIGYVTNVIAIRLLFKPRKKTCILLGRACIQGLIPAHKDAIAARLASVAANYALSDSVRRRYREKLESEMVKLVENIVLDRIRGLQENPLTSPLVSLIAPGLAEAFAKAVAPAVLKLLDEASTRINVSEILEEELREMPLDVIEKAFREIAGRELRFIELMGFILGFIIGLAEGVLAILLY